MPFDATCRLTFGFVFLLNLTKVDLLFNVVGHVIVSKVFLGRSVHLREGVPVDPKADSVYRNMGTELGVRSHRGADKSPQMFLIF